MKKPPPRQIALYGALGLSLAATAWVSCDDAPDTVTPAPRHTAPTITANAASDWPGPAAGTRAEWPALDPQARAAWGEAAPVAATPPPPPTAEVASAAPPPPSAPPFPYQLVGRLTDTRPRAILNNAQRSAVVGVGEVLDGQWRVEAIEPAGLRLTYLPLGLAQFVPFAAAPAA